MSRPAYESNDDLRREQEAVEALEAIWGVRCRKTPRYYEIDYCIVSPRDQVEGWVEVRCKRFPKDQHRTFYTSLKKYITLCRFAQATGLPAYILCRWEDTAPMLHRIEPANVRNCPITIGGRTVNSRGDDQDIEPVIHLPIDSFLNIAEN
jgi:hypothetical protein